MLRVERPNTYKAPMPRLGSEFYDFEGVEDEAAGRLLTHHVVGLLHRARKTKLLHLAQPSAATATRQHPKASGWLRPRLQQLLTGEGVSLFLPNDLVSRLVRDVVRMTEGEPNGVRSCTLSLQVCDGSRRVVVGKIVCDPRVPSSITLVVQLMRAPAPPHAHNFRFLNKGQEAIYFSPGYLLEKRRHHMAS